MEQLSSLSVSELETLLLVHRKLASDAKNKLQEESDIVIKIKAEQDLKPHHLEVQRIKDELASREEEVKSTLLDCLTYALAKKHLWLKFKGNSPSFEKYGESVVGTFIFTKEQEALYGELHPSKVPNHGQCYFNCTSSNISDELKLDLLNTGFDSSEIRIVSFS